MNQSKSKKKRTAARRSPWPIVLMVGGLLVVAVVIGGSLINGSPQTDAASGPGTPALAIAGIQPSPGAAVEGLKVDFGDMKLGAELANLHVTLRNNGDGTLTFSQPPYIQLADGC